MEQNDLNRDLAAWAGQRAPCIAAAFTIRPDPTGGDSKNYEGRIGFALEGEISLEDLCQGAASLVQRIWELETEAAALFGVPIEVVRGRVAAILKGDG